MEKRYLSSALVAATGNIFPIILVILLILSRAGAADTVSIEDFRKMSPAERAQAIQNAPHDQKEKLTKIEVHMELQSAYGGEEGLKREKETQIACGRGLCDIEGAFDLYSQFWDGYLATVWKANKKAGMTQKQQEAGIANLRKERDDVTKRVLIAHALVFHLSSSPQALALENRAKLLVEDLSKKYTLLIGSNPRPVKRAEIMALKKKMDHMLEEMKTFPTVPPDELQKAYDAFPEEKMRRGSL